MGWLDNQTDKVANSVNNAVDEKINAIGEKIWWHLYDILVRMWDNLLDLASVIAVIFMIWFVIKLMLLKNKQDSMLGLFLSGVSYIIIAMMIRVF